MGEEGDDVMLDHAFDFIDASMSKLSFSPLLPESPGVAFGTTPISASRCSRAPRFRPRCGTASAAPILCLFRAGIARDHRAIFSVGGHLSLCVPARARRYRAGGAEPRPARPYPLRRTAPRSPRRSCAISISRRRRERTPPPRRWPRFSRRRRRASSLRTPPARTRFCAAAAGSRRSAARVETLYKEAEELKPFGVRPALLDRAALTALEPHVGEKASGVCIMPSL